MALIAVANVAFASASCVAGNRRASRWTFDISFPAIALSAPELVNPMRGLYTFYDEDVATLPREPYLRYTRFFWSEIETTPHHFDFSKLDAEINRAAWVNGRAAFRIMPCSPGETEAVHVGVPSDFPSILQKGYFIEVSPRAGGAGHKVYVPDYNDPVYLSRAQELITALAARYDGDPRIAYIEAGLIGTWGEGNYSQMPNPTPSGALRPTFATDIKIIDGFCRAFQHTRIIVPTDIFKVCPKGSDEADYKAKYHNALEYTLLKYKNVGIFRNSLGHVEHPNWFTAPFSDPYVVAAGGNVRWQVAPFAVEWYGEPEPITGQIAQGLSEIPKYHAAVVADGALGHIGPVTSQTMQELQTCGKEAGYRIQLRRVCGRAVTNSRRTLQVESSWENVGVTPVYEPWVAVYKLSIAGSNTVVWQSESSLDMRRLMPTNGTPLVVNDTLVLPRPVPAGKYRLSITVEDSTKYYKHPLRLASLGARADGSYNLAILQIE